MTLAWVAIGAVALLAAGTVVGESFSSRWQSFASRHRRIEFGLVVASVVLIAAIAVVANRSEGTGSVVAFVTDGSGPTTEYVFDASRLGDPPVDEGAVQVPVDCARSETGSLRSNRQGAMLCVSVVPGYDGAGLLLDPCLPASRVTVACTRIDQDGIRVQVLSIYNMFPADRLVVHPPTGDSWPWAIRLESGATCYWELFEGHDLESNSPDSSPTYLCAPMIDFAKLGFEAQADGELIWLEGVYPDATRDQTTSPRAADLRREESSDWTVMFADSRESTYTRVRVAAVWF